MDSAWAALIGTVVGAAVSTGVPWIREVITEKRRSEQTRRDKLADALVEVVSLLSLRLDRQVRTAEDLAKFELAAAKFTLLTVPEDGPVIDMFVTVSAAIGSSDRNVRQEVYVIFVDVITRWHQGVLTAQEAAAEYKREAPRRT
jgi:hypothetical protein